MESYDKIYFRMTHFLSILKRIGLYNLPGIKGLLYRCASKQANSQFRHGKKVMQDTRRTFENVIVSLTTYGDRIKTVSTTIETLLLQTVKPSRIILWLSKDEVKEFNQLPKGLQQLLSENDLFEIQFCEDLKPHKKYYYTMINYPSSIVVTADDDVYYPSCWLEDLLELHQSHPNCICCTNAHFIKISENGEIGEYNSWEHLTEKCGPSLLLCPIGVGGVLYPPNSLSKKYFFDVELIKSLCLNADDLWLKFNSLLNKTQVVKTAKYNYTFLSVGDTQEITLSQENVSNHKNDLQLRNIINLFGKEIREVLCKDR